MRKMLKPLVFVIGLSVALAPVLQAGTFETPRRHFHTFLAEHLLDFAAIFHFIPSIDVPRDQQLPLCTVDEVLVAGGLTVDRLGDGD
jgi:hypothetical protein